MKRVYKVVWWISTILVRDIFFLTAFFLVICSHTGVLVTRPPTPHWIVWTLIILYLLGYSQPRLKILNSVSKNTNTTTLLTSCCISLYDHSFPIYQFCEVYNIQVTCVCPLTHVQVATTSSINHIHPKTLSLRQYIFVYGRFSIIHWRAGITGRVFLPARCTFSAWLTLDNKHAVVW